MKLNIARRRKRKGQVEILRILTANRKLKMKTRYLMQFMPHPSAIFNRPEQPPVLLSLSKQRLPFVSSTNQTARKRNPNCLSNKKTSSVSTCFYRFLLAQCGCCCCVLVDEYCLRRTRDENESKSQFGTLQSTLKWHFT